MLINFIVPDNDLNKFIMSPKQNLSFRSYIIILCDET